MNLALLALTSLAVVRGVNAYAERPEDGKVFVDEKRRLVLESSNGVVIPHGRVLIAASSAAADGSDSGGGGAQQKMIDVAEQIGLVVEELRLLANQSTSSKNDTDTLTVRLGANVDAVARLAELAANHTAEAARLSQTVQEQAANHTSEVAQLSGTVEVLTTNQTRHISEITQLSGTVEELTANQTRHAAEVVQLSSTVEELKANQTKLQSVKEQVKMISDAMKDYDLYTQCGVGSWSGFGKCSHECDGGTMERTRSIKPLAGYEDVKNACPVGKETLSCNTGACPRDCKIGNFTNWTECSSQCGPGTQVRTRQLLRGAVGGGACPKLLETQACEVNSEEDQEECTKAVLDMLDGTWNQTATSSKGYKVCAGGEIDTAEKLKPFKGCQLIAGNLKFFVPIDFDFDGTFDDLVAVSGDVSFYNTGLKELTKETFPALEAIGGTLLVAHNTALETCVGFQLLHAVRGLVNVNNNAKLKELALVELQHVEGNLEVKENSEVATVSLPKLKAVNGAIDFQYNNQIRKIVFDMLHSVADNFIFMRNQVLTSVEAPDLRRIGAKLHISFNTQLDEVSFPRLTQIIGMLYFYNLNSLEYLDMPELTIIKGNVEISSVYKIVSISMPKLMEIESNMYISSLNKLTSISMPRMTQVRGRFRISSCNELGSLSDFDYLSTIEGDMQIYNNKQLQCIKGLSNVTKIKDTLSIYGNTKLFMCSELYTTLRTAARVVNDQNSYVNRDDCDHACDSADVRQDCVLGDFGNWSTCSDVCGPATQFRAQTIVKAATNGGRCNKKTESQDCEKSRFNTACDDTVSKIIAGTWTEGDSSKQKVCDGGEIDDESQLAKYDGCEIIDGNLKFFIAADVDFEKVQTFSSLLAVSGDVVFFGTALTDLGPTIFSNLQVIGGKFLVGHNNELLSMKAFRSLHTVGSDYKIDQNEKLFACETLSVVTIGGAFQVLTNNKLSEVTMPKVETVGGELRFYYNHELKTAIYLDLKTVGALFFFYQNGQVVTVEMPSLTVVNDFRFSSNVKLQTLDMSGLETVADGSFSFNSNNAIREVVFSSLTYVDNQFEFDSNTQMELLSCPALAKLGSKFQVSSNSRLKEISMPELAEISSNVLIQNNPQLTAIKAFGKLTKVGNRFQIKSNHKLQCIRGFENVTSIGSELCISENSKLFMCDELADGLKEAAQSTGNTVCSSFSYVPRDNCDHVCE